MSNNKRGTNQYTRWFRRLRNKILNLIVDHLIVPVLTFIFQKIVWPIVRFLKWFFKWTFILGGIALLVAGFAEGYRYMITPVQSAHAESQTIEVEKVIEIPADLQHKADCESGVVDKKTGRAYRNTATQFEKDGVTVLDRGNSNRTIDTGWCQVNSIHRKEATRMSLDLRDENDNKSFCKYLYKTQGSKPWGASKSCWSQPYMD